MPDTGRQTPGGGRGTGAAPPGGQGTGADGRHRRLLRSAGTVGALTAVSRIFGAIRDALVGALLGTTDVADAFGASYQLSNTLRRLASEGNLAAAFVPVFSRVESRRGADAEVFAARFYSVAALLVAVLSAVGAATVHWIVPLVFWGYVDAPEKLSLIVVLTRLLFAYAFFISLSAVLMAVLNARDRFGAAAFTPVLSNLAIIAAGILAWALGAPRPVYWLVGGVIAGGFAQWAFLLPFARGLGIDLRPRLDLSDPDVRAVGRLILPRLLGVGVVQVNILVGQVLAAGLGEGALISLYYATRIQELTLGIFAVSVATVVLPTLSRQGATGDHTAMRATLSFALRQVTAITLPAAVGIVLLRGEIVAVLFERGRFDAASTALTAAALTGYAVGLVSVAAVRVLAPGFYALHDTRTPVAVALVGVVVNLAACLALRGPLGNAGIALANSLAATVGGVLLLWLLRQRLGRLDGRAMLGSVSRVVAASVAMGAAVTWVPTPFLAGMPGLAGAPDLVVRIAAGMLVYLAALVALRAPEVAELRTLLTGRRPDTLASGAYNDSGGGAGGAGT